MESFRIRIALGLVALSLGLVSGDADTNTIFFRHYSNESYRDVNIQQITKLIPLLNLNECTVFYIHGYMSNVETDSVTVVIDAYLQRTNCNMIAIDYRKIADNINYITDVLSVDVVGVALAGGLNQLIARGLNHSKIHIIGHSLGAQVASRVGIHTNFVVPRITGLDPAGPLFQLRSHLDCDNGGFVDIIHTDGGVFGQVSSSGCVDFHPNLGHRPQPGCPLISFKDQYCHHERSWEFYAESVLNPNGFLGIKCDDSLQFITGQCNQADVVPMGYATPTSARGDYYLRTNSQSPFAQGRQGI